MVEWKAKINTFDRTLEVYMYDEKNPVEFMVPKSGNHMKLHLGRLNEVFESVVEKGVEAIEDIKQVEESPQTKTKVEEGVIIETVSSETKKKIEDELVQEQAEIVEEEKSTDFEIIRAVAETEILTVWVSEAEPVD